jgi:hypothetical protein
MTHRQLIPWQRGARKARAPRASLRVEPLEARILLTKSLVLVPSPAINGLELVGAAAVASNDIWATGIGEAQPVVEHFDGTQWSVVSTPSLTGASLTRLAAVASNDVWAVGSLTTVVHKQTLTSTLTEHWDGTSWSVVSSPTPANGGYLALVAAVSSKDVWAAGNALDSSGTPVSALVEHWDGTSWSIVSSAAFNGATNPVVSADASNDVWAVAFASSASGAPFTGPAVLHFDGTSWSLINPNTGVTGVGIDALSPTDVWAVGQGRDSDGDSNFARIEHFDGTSWSIVPSPRVNPPEPLDTQSGLGGVAAISANDIWAVGEALNQTLTEHWDGTSWSVITSPDPGKFNVLVAATALGDGTVAAVGYQTDFAGHTFGIILQNAASAPKTASPAAVPTRTTPARPAAGPALAAAATAAMGTMPAPLDALAVDQLFAATDPAGQSFWPAGRRSRTSRF